MKTEKLLAYLPARPLIEIICLGIILILAVVLRLTGLDWDNYDHYQPDERYITWVATSIEWPTDWRTAFHPTQSTFNPYYWPSDAASAGIIVPQDEPRRFAYGHFPLYLGVIVTRFMEWVGPVIRPFFPSNGWWTQDILNGAGLNEFRHLTAVSRFVTALTDVGTVGVVYLLGKRMYGTAVGLLAAAFLAFNVLHIQLARFFAFDPFMTFFVVTAIYWMVVSLDEGRGVEIGDGRLGFLADLQTRRLVHLLLAAICIGLAIGSKFSAVLLLLPLAVTVYLGTAESEPTPSPFRWRRWEKQLLLLGGVVFLAFAFTNPFSVLDWTCEATTDPLQLGPMSIPEINWHSCYLENITLQGSMARGSSDNTFTRQYIDTTPYLYPVEMQLRWGMGLLLGVVAFGGFAWAVWKTVQYSVLSAQYSDGTFHVSRFTFYASVVLLTWTLPLFLTTGNFHAKFMRYLQPLAPFLMLYAAAWLVNGKQRWWRWAIAGLVLGATGLYALTFINMYRERHPWIEASEWIYRNVPRGTRILTEQWDDALPSSMKVDGVMRTMQEYRLGELTWIAMPDSADNEEKLMKNLQQLAEAEYVTIASNRIYGVVPRLPDRYPISSQYHQLLFDGSLGYEVVFVNGRFPHLFGFYLKPDTFTWPGLRPPSLVASYLAGLPGVNWGRADESFLVYDQPLTIIFRNVEHKTAEEMYQLFEVK